MQARVGEMQDIICSVSTAFETDTSEITLTWVGPEGVIIEDDRVSIVPTFSDGNTFTTILQFDYLMEDDEGVYTCDIMIGENVETLSVELQNINSKSIHNREKLLHFLKKIYAALLHCVLKM